MRPVYCIQPNQNGLPREALAIINAKCDFIIRRDAEPGCIPIGSVEFCEPVFGQQPGLKQFYPEFLHHLMGRSWGVVSQPRAYRTAFYKDATKWKSDFVARVYHQGEEFPVKCPLMYESEVVEFINEWRLYVANGVLMDLGWYRGTDEDKSLSFVQSGCGYPIASLEWPANFSGAVDVGELPDGRIALVEAHPPFACGWYGESYMAYAVWMEHAWKSRDFWIRKGK